MGQTYCNNCCVNQKLTSFQNQIQNFAKHNDHTPLQTFAVKVKQTIELNAAVKQIYHTYRKQHFAQRTGTKLDVHYLFNYAAYYEGEWKNGLPHGQGKLIYDDGSMYEGCFKQGYADCQQAIFIYKTGAFYRGQVKGNKANGQGELSTHKFYYKGRWLNDLPNGKGRQIYGTNTYFEGDFVHGKKQGLGIYYWNAKQYFSGNFSNNLMEGNGQLILNDYTYRGGFKNGVKDGLGVLINNKNNWKYQGHFLNNQMNGMGKYHWADGTVFQGKFDNDQRTNQGVLILKSGKVIDCRIPEDK